MFRWLERRLGRDRRWISDPAERDAHDAAVRARLDQDDGTDEDRPLDHLSTDEIGPTPPDRPQPSPR